MISALAPLALGAADDIITSLSEPDVFYRVSGSIAEIQLYYVFQTSGPSPFSEGTYLDVVHVIIPVSEIPDKFNVSAQSSWGYFSSSGLWAAWPYNTVITGTHDRYNLLTGSLTESETYNYATNPFRFGFSYYPQNSAGTASQFKGGYWVLPDGISATQSGSPSVPFVVWSVTPPEVSIYRSHLTEPVYDPQNIYFIETSQEGFGKLYWLSIYSVEFQNLSTQNGSLGSESSVYWESVSGPLITNVFIPTITYTEDHGTTCMIYIDPQLDPYHLTNFVCRFDLTFSVLDLESGQLIDCVRIADDTTNVLYNLVLDSYFIPSAQIESCKSYGFCFRNLDQRLVNMASVIWSVDPVVDHWRENIFDLVSDIRDAIVGDSETVPAVTQPDIIGSLSQAQDGLILTYADGQTVGHGGGGRDIFDATLPQEAAQTVLGFFSSFYNDFIAPNPELVVFLSILLALSVAAVILGLVL